MGHWGVCSYENDDAGDALDAAFDRVHGSAYDDMMDDRDPMTVDQIHKKLASSQTLAAAVAWLSEEFGDDLETWDEIARLAFVGVVVRHKEMGVAIPVRPEQAFENTFGFGCPAAAIARSQGRFLHDGVEYDSTDDARAARLR
jgi:hypothetical protein